MDKNRVVKPRNRMRSNQKVLKSSADPVKNESGTTSNYFKSAAGSAAAGESAPEMSPSPPLPPISLLVENWVLRPGTRRVARLARHPACPSRVFRKYEAAELGGLKTRCRYTWTSTCHPPLCPSFHRSITIHTEIGYC